jgi:hypothetical protein
METSSLIDFDGIDIKQHEHMKNAINNLNNHQYLSYNNQTKIINEYNNPTLISCMYPIVVTYSQFDSNIRVFYIFLGF